MKYLIVGLGNIGIEYRMTRHNIGFMVADCLVEDGTFSSSRHADVAEVKYKGRTLIVVKPTTYMNLSGKAVAHHMTAHKISPENILVITDDIALDYGTIRLRKSGSPGGHNGLKSINEHLGNDQYPRMRVGVGSNFRPGQQADYVLSPFTADEQTYLPDVLAHCLKAVYSYCTLGLEKTMSDFNKSVVPNAKK
jgi:peptidyl-tRNA hydrolase, PTH1 family